MASQLVNTVESGPIDVSSSVVVPHHLNTRGTALMPDLVLVSVLSGAVDVTVDDEAITFTNPSPEEAASASAFLISFHTFQRVFGNSPLAGQFTSLPIKPYVLVACCAGSEGPPT